MKITRETECWIFHETRKQQSTNFIDIAYVWRNRSSLAPTRLRYGISHRCRTTSIRWGLQPRNSGMSDGRLVAVSGTQSVISRTTTSSPRLSRLTNALMTSTRSQVSAFFKNSLRRSNRGTQNDKTETREQTRRTTASVEMTIHEVQSHSKTEGSNAIQKTAESACHRENISQTTDRISSSASTKLGLTSTSLPWRVFSRFEPSGQATSGNCTSSVGS
ncbi:MAG: hypothetical protein J07HR59_00042, partial [Halorubrum sp. J07HR59]